MSFVLRRRAAIASVALVAFAWSFLLFPVSVAAEPVTIPAGTPIVCSFNEEVTPATATVGQQITLRVAEPVVIGGVTVIQAGATVTGEVTQAQTKGAVGKPAVIGVTLRSVSAADGTTVPISGTRVIEGESKQTTSLVVTILCCVLGLLMKGGEASIPAGAQITGTVTGNVTVNV